MPPKEQFKLKKGELSKAWKDSFKTKDEFKGFDEYEDGRYLVALTDADRGESKSSGRDQVMFEFTFLDGDYKGKTKRDYSGLDRAEAIPHLLRKIEQMGFDAPEEVDELEGILKKMVKERPKLRIILKTKGEFQNVYIDKVLEEGDLPDGIEEDLPPAKKGEDDDEPKPKDKVKKEKPANPEDDGEEGEVSVGTRVRCLDGDDEEEGVGEVMEIDEPNMEVLVKMDEGGKKRVYAVDKLRLLPKEKPKMKLKK